MGLHFWKARYLEVALAHSGVAVGSLLKSVRSSRERRVRVKLLVHAATPHAPRHMMALHTQYPHPTPR